MSFADATIARLPRPVRPFAERHHELIKFAIVGATTFVIDSAIFYTLKLTILEPKPVTAKIIAGIVAVIASYILNREWSFRDRGGRERHHEALLFFGVSGVGVMLSMAPLAVSSYVLMLRVPMVSLTTENIADFISAYIIGNLLQMMFRFWAFRRFVFPDEFARNPDKAVESTFTAGGIAEMLEDEYELRRPMGQQDPDNVVVARPLPRGTTPLVEPDNVDVARPHPRGTTPLVEPDNVVTPLRRSRRRAARQLGDSSDPTVSKTS